MSAVRLQPTRALWVIPENTIDIPYPALAASGINTAVVSNQLVDSNAKFLSSGVKTGDVIYSRSIIHAGYVSRVLSDTALSIISPLSFLTVGNDYLIYDGSSNTGCTLYIGGSTTSVRVMTINDEDITFSITGGNFLPVKVKRVFSSNTNSPRIIALW